MTDLTNQTESTPRQSAPLPPDPDLYIGRDLAWLDFNERVLAQAEDEARPLFDRLRFLAICESNLDEFFMKRVALLRRRIELGLEKSTHDGLSVRQQLTETRKRVDTMLERQRTVWRASLLPSLLAEGIKVTAVEDLPRRHQDRVDEWFHRHVFPLLTPLAVDPGHPFPFISNLSSNFGVLLAEPGEDEARFARVKIPDAIPSWIRVPVHGPVGAVQDTTPCRVVRVADIVRRNLEAIFPGMRMLEVLEFRVTRGVGLEDDDDDVQDLAEWVRASLRHRRFAEAVRLETAADPSPSLVQVLLEELDLEPESHYQRGTPLEWGGLLDLARFDRSDLSSPKWQPIVPKRLADPDEPIFDAIRRADILVIHPYDSFHASVERFIAEAAADPQVVAIKQCLYRTAPDSPFIHSLLQAAESGKQVTCLVELRARFDEHRNLQLTRTLEKHGVHVAYGVVGMKTHAKCSLVIRKEGRGFRAYAHIGTGNYHPGTASSYSDCGLLTCDDDITGDVIQVFNYLTGRSRHADYEKLLVAPLTMRDQLLAKIRRETENALAGRPARIIAKMNQLEDPLMMQALVEASTAGVSCDLVVRGFCCLKAGVPGLTENLRVRSIVGDFLEHSRIFHFAAGREHPREGEWYIGSADWMHRNLGQRVEVVAPVEDAEARKRLHRVLTVNLNDCHDAWVLRGGVWEQCSPSETAADDSPERLGTFDTLRRDAMRAKVEAMSDAKVRASAIKEERLEPETPPEAAAVLGGVERIVGMALLESPWRTAAEIARRVNISPALAAAAGRRLAADGLIDVRSLGRHRIWLGTPSLADALGGPLTMSPGRDPDAAWLIRRIVRWLRISGWKVTRGGATGCSAVAESSDGGRDGWIIRSERRGAAKAFREAMCDDWSHLHAVGSTNDVVSAFRDARADFSPSDRKRTTVHALGPMLKQTDIEAEE
ncbi:MAG: polyphosphate kinase 1 [Phycisphaerales bacterium]|nr:polyphosphate kinase 1 [Phycisphaerales bacterium]